MFIGNRRFNQWSITNNEIDSAKFDSLLSKGEVEAFTEESISKFREDALQTLSKAEVENQLSTLKEVFVVSAAGRKKMFVRPITSPSNDLEKGLGGDAQIGETRTWGGKKYQKQAGGKWIPVKDSSQGMGKVAKVNQEANKFVQNNAGKNPEKTEKKFFNASDNVAEKHGDKAANAFESKVQNNFASGAANSSNEGFKSEENSQSALNTLKGISPSEHIENHGGDFESFKNHVYGTVGVKEGENNKVDSYLNDMKEHFQPGGKTSKGQGDVSFATNAKDEKKNRVLGNLKDGVETHAQVFEGDYDKFSKHAYHFMGVKPGEDTEVDSIMQEAKNHFEKFNQGGNK